MKQLWKPRQRGNSGTGFSHAIGVLNLRFPQGHCRVVTGAQMCNLTEPCDLSPTWAWGLWPQCHPFSSSRPPGLHQLIPVGCSLYEPPLTLWKPQQSLCLGCAAARQTGWHIQGWEQSPKPSASEELCHSWYCSLFPAVEMGSRCTYIEFSSGKSRALWRGFSWELNAE